MKSKSKRRYSMPIIIIPVLLYVLFMGTWNSGRAEGDITINEKTYEMCSLTLAEFMEDGYELSVVNILDKQATFFNYYEVMLEAKTTYNSGFPINTKEGEGAPIVVWLYNKSSQPIGIGEGKINSISCDISALLEEGITVSIAGLELDGQSMEDIAAWMDRELKGYLYTKGEDGDLIHYKKGRYSYTFIFSGDNTLLTAVVGESMNLAYVKNIIPRGV